MALLSRDSSLVPSNAVFRREPRRRRVRCCARAADIARLLVVPPLPVLCGIPEWRPSSPSWSMSGWCRSREVCAVRLTRRKESLERRELESLRLWLLLALPDSVRGDSSWSAKPAVIVHWCKWNRELASSTSRWWGLFSILRLLVSSFDRLKFLFLQRDML